jgi:hypothetical protein
MPYMTIPRIPEESFSKLEILWYYGSYLILLIITGHPGALLDVIVHNRS